MNFGLLGPAFIAGLLTFLAPCTLPLVPGYLAFIGGVSKEELQNTETASFARKKIIRNGLFFIFGFTIVFVMFGMLAGFVGYALAPYRLWLSRIGGVFVMVFGLFLLGVFKLPFLQRERRLRFPRWLHVGTPTSSAIIGGTFAVGWTPCVGPILASILFLASNTATVFGGGFLLLIFSLGLGVPFLLVAIGFSHATAYLTKLSRVLSIVSVVGGLFLIVLGWLLVTDNFGLTIFYGYRVLDFLHYRSLLQYL